MAEWLADVDEAGGKRAFSMDEIEAARADVARVFGAPADRLAFVKNTSEGINIVAQGLDWQPGDNLVISTEEHENNTFPGARWPIAGLKCGSPRPVPTAWCRSTTTARWSTAAPAWSRSPG